MPGVICLRCGAQGYRTTIPVAPDPNMPLNSIVVQIDLCQRCRSLAGRENVAAQRRKGVNP